MNELSSKFFWSLLLIAFFCASCFGQTKSSTVQKSKVIPIVQKIKEDENLSVDERIALYKQLKKESPELYDFSNEDELTMFGYGYLWSDQVDNALKVFTLIAEEFPESANAYDSIGEAYLQKGDKEKSLKYYEKSVSMDPDNFNAEDVIEKIKFPETKQETLSEKFDKVYTVQEYKDDLDQLGQRILEVHPYALKFITKDDFLSIVEKKKALINNNTTFSEFAWHCSEIIASINCSHTDLEAFYPQLKAFPEHLKFPLQTRLVDNKLFVIDPLTNSDKVSVKDEITSINGIGIDEIIKTIYPHISSQGLIETSKKNDFNRWSTGMIPFAVGLPKTYQIQVKGKDNPIQLIASQSTKDPMPDESISRCKEDLCLDFSDDNKSVVMTISTFNYYTWNNFEVFKEFADKSFEEIKDKGTQQLIIDLRFNGGGSPESSAYLLRYLLDKPFNYFINNTYPSVGEVQEPFQNRYRGKLYFLIDGNGKSTTGHFMAMVKDRKLGPIIGEELGSNQFCTGGQKICRLKNTKLVYYVANGAAEFSVKSFPEEVGILPDHFVTQSIEAYLNKEDEVKQYAIKLAAASEK